MNITADTIYWISVADQIRFGLMIVFILFIILSGLAGVTTICFWMDWESVKERIKEAKSNNTDFYDAIHDKDLSWIERARILEEIKEKTKRRCWDVPSFEYATSLLSQLKVCSVVFLLCLVIFFSSLTGWFFTPDSRTRAAMLVVPTVLNNGDVKQFPKDALDLADDYLREMLMGASKDCSSCK